MGETVTATITPNTGYEISSILFNTISKTISTSLTLTPIEAYNFLVITFSAIPAAQTFTITESHNDGGSVSLSKTSGTVGETVYATIICNSGYTPTATLNGTAVTLTQNIANPLKYTAEITPITGTNSFSVTFSQTT